MTKQIDQPRSQSWKLYLTPDNEFRLCEMAKQSKTSISIILNTALTIAFENPDRVLKDAIAFKSKRI